MNPAFASGQARLHAMEPPGMSNQVTCITKPHPHSPREHITEIGGYRPDGAWWQAALDDVVRMIDSGQYQFHVQVGLYNVAVETYEHNGRRFVRTTADETRVDNLLSLDQCPVRNRAA
jgi:hypothetical protein